MDDETRQRQLEEMKKAHDAFLRQELFSALDSPDKDQSLQKVEVQRAIFELLHRCLDDATPASKGELGYATQLVMQYLAFENMALHQRIAVLEAAVLGRSDSAAGGTSGKL